MKNGILLIDKPMDFTSHDVVAKARGILKMKKIGHSGTLDPMATGVLPLFLGSATKACDRMPNQNKAYLATVKLGIVTDTQDVTGKVLRTSPVTAKKAEVEECLKSFLGKTMQLPPMFSAVQVNGKRLYDLARQGIEVERPSREIEVYEIKLMEWNEAEGEYVFSVSCSKGTYVRTICQDLGDKLGCGATLKALRRTNSSGFLLENCVTLVQLREIAGKNELSEYLLPVSSVFEEYEKIVLTQKLEKMFFNGVPLWLGQIEIDPNDQMVGLYNEAGEFLGIAKANKEKNQLTNQQQFKGVTLC